MAKGQGSIQFVLFRMIEQAEEERPLGSRSLFPVFHHLTSVYVFALRQVSSDQDVPYVTASREPLFMRTDQVAPDSFAAFKQG